MIGRRFRDTATGVALKPALTWLAVSSASTSEASPSMPASTAYAMSCGFAFGASTLFTMSAPM
ncbi:hypothetical protein RHOFW104T7_08965 [Rhodanobacter thiooxydans]|uniref:Uncharacterized protein n=1 Tax=Rhodanobacter thiooxydans TaxID=416169 RepID=A0A154QJP1_9GAMM|nr:hypothetical protein RHOFW104T7_08965 [Rhodanobacter thiooxydans]